MYKHIFLNPFYWFSLIWGCILALYPFRWAEEYPPMTAGITIFFAFLILISLVVGYFFSRWMKRVEITYTRPRYVLPFAALISCGFLADFLWARQVPLFDELTGAERTYMDFKPMPLVHMLVFTFAFFYAAYLFYCFVREKSLKHRLLYLGGFCLILFWYACLYNRSVLMMLAFICVLILLSSLKRIRIWHLAGAACFAVVALYLFGIFGNIRSGAANPNDTSYLIMVADINMEKVPGFLPAPFLWAYVYIVTPFGNLINYITHYTPEYSFLGLLSCILPDLISLRFLPWFDSTIPLVLENLNVSSGFAELYKFAGYAGMLVGFAYMVAMVLVLTRLIRRRAQFFIPLAALLTCMTAFLFFDNFLNYSGVILAFCYPFLAMGIEHIVASRRRGEVCLLSALCRENGSSSSICNGEVPAEEMVSAEICETDPIAPTTPKKETTPMKTCLVMLCTYNGEAYLREQIDSVLAEENILTHVKVADDRSSDGTVAILEDYAARYPDRFSFSVNETNKRFTYNFLDLFHSTKDTDYDYYAFCDQDDVWLPEKLSRAAAKIEEAGDTPRGTLYCSNLTVVNEHLEKTAMQESPEMIRRTSRMTVLFENIATGCTIVMDKRFHDHALSHYPENIQLHDYWLFLIAVYTANAIYDPEAYILYRQHGGNQIGTNKRKWTLENIKKFFRMQPKQEHLFRELLIGYGDLILPAEKRDMERIRDYRHSLRARWKLFFDPKYHKRNHNLILRAKILFRKM